MVAGRIAFVSRELAPFGGGGIGPYVRALADLLAGDFELTLFTTSRHRREHERLVAAGSDALPRARIVFVPEPRGWDGRSSYNLLHAWSGSAHETLVAEYGERGPDLIEFPDFLGEGCVTVQARRTLSRAFRETTVAARAYGTAEMYDVLDGFKPRERERAFTYELERYALRYADAFLWPGGDVLDSYQRFYGEDGIANPVQIHHPFAWEAAAAPASASPAADGPLRVLYFGRLERRKGVRRLLGALLGLEQSEWRVTILGADTETAPLGQSMRALLASEAAGDPRVDLREPIPRADVPALIDAHDLVVVPSLWECWPNVALEAMERGRPVLATPTGGMVDIVEPGVTGWLAADTSEPALRAALAPLVAAPDRVRVEIDPGRVRERARALSAEPPVAEAYAALCEPRPSATPSLSRTPRVSIVIPYFQMERYVAAAVKSAAAQTYREVEVVIVNDGSFRPEDGILGELERRHGATVVSQPNGGLGAARNLGIAVSSGEYVLPLDADNVLEPGFVARCVEVLEADDSIAYVTSWLRYIDEQGGPWKGTDEGLQPIGNSSDYVESHNVAGDATAVFRRSVFDRLSYSLDVAGFEDWALFREMRRAGLIGHVIPEPLIGYRVRGDSMMRTLSSPREEWIEQAIDAHLREREVGWTAGAS